LELVFVEASYALFLSPSFTNNPLSNQLQTPQYTTMAARVKETAKEEALHVRQLAEDGVKSGAYVYPIKVGGNV
jgi:hypothetical protein